MHALVTRILVHTRACARTLTISVVYVCIYMHFSDTSLGDVGHSRRYLHHNNAHTERGVRDSEGTARTQTCGQRLDFGTVGGHGQAA